MRILVVNAGSSTIKIKVYELADDPAVEPQAPVWESAVDSGESPEGALNSAFSAVPQIERIQAVGHRVVHGGGRFRAPVRITEDVKGGISEASLFAPDHNRLQLMGIDTATDLLGNAIPQFAVFDTAFHATLPPSAYVYPGPYEWHAQGIRRYGFHGISHQYCASRCAALIGSPVEALRMVTCHLGNGCSLAAIRAGACVDTTMGFTPMEGLMMGTRSGSVDPGILLHLLKSGQCTAEELERILSRESGIKGIAGGTGDMRDLLVRIQRGEARAQLAFDIFVHRVRSGIAAMAASAGGLDVLVFTGGIGEHAAPVRAAVCAGLEFLGVRLGELNHRAGDSDIPISAPDTAVQVFVVQAREEWQIAKECRRLASTSEPQ